MFNRVLVLGGLGFVGRHVCKALCSQGISVYAIGHASLTGNDIDDWGIANWVTSAINLENLNEFYKELQFDAVIHCAGSGAVSLSYQQPFDDYQRSVTTVLAALEFVRTTQPTDTRFVLASSAAVYGNQHMILAEQSNLNPISPYGMHKLAAENICAEYSRFFNVNTSVVRLFSIYGVGLKKQLLWDAAIKFKNKQSDFFGTGNEMRDWIYIEDAAELMCNVALHKQSKFEIYNCGHHHVSTREVLTILEGFLTNSLALEFNNQEHIGNPVSLIGASSYAKNFFGWNPKTSLVTGLEMYAEWFKQHHD